MDSSAGTGEPVQPAAATHPERHRQAVVLASTYSHSFNSTMFAPIANDEFYSIWWNRILTAVSVLNVFLFISVLISRRSRPAAPLHVSSHPFASLWRFLHRHQLLLAFIYVVACGVRATWPRMDGDRHCFVDHWISLVSIGRSLATVAELAYCAQICLALIQVCGGGFKITWLATIMLAFNVVAQSCCWFTVLTRDNRGHITEESIWMLSGLTVTLIAWFRNIGSAKLSENARSFIRSARFVGFLFVIFMCTVDIPMYVDRHLADQAANATFLTFEQGWRQIQQCVHVSQKDAFWIQEMPWMSMYFSFAVWSSLWLAHANLQLTQQIETASKKSK